MASILVTGIPGSGASEFCSRSREQRGATTKVYRVQKLIGKELQRTPERPPFHPERLLDFHPEIFEQAKNTVFRDIGFSSMNGEYERVLVRAQAQIFAGNVIRNGISPEYLDLINPELYVTIIDRGTDIKAKQMRTIRGRIEDHDMTALLIWQNAEVNLTQMLAQVQKKPMYILPAQQDPSIIDSLLENWFLMYYQMPMTDASSEENQMISDFKERMEDIGTSVIGHRTPIIDPRHIDMEPTEGRSKVEIDTIQAQTPHRDLEWYIAKSTCQVAYYPKSELLDKPTISAGVSQESYHGFVTGKDIFVVYPGDRVSPFIHERAHKVFRDEESFFDFFPDYLEQAYNRLRRNTPKISMT